MRRRGLPTTAMFAVIPAIYFIILRSPSGPGPGWLQMLSCIAFIVLAGIVGDRIYNSRLKDNTTKLSRIVLLAAIFLVDIIVAYAWSLATFRLLT